MNDEVLKATVEKDLHTHDPNMDLYHERQLLLDQYKTIREEHAALVQSRRLAEGWALLGGFAIGAYVAGAWPGVYLDIAVGLVFGLAVISKGFKR